MFTNGTSEESELKPISNRGVGRGFHVYDEIPTGTSEKGARGQKNLPDSFHTKPPPITMKTWGIIRNICIQTGVYTFNKKLIL